MPPENANAPVGTGRRGGDAIGKASPESLAPFPSKMTPDPDEYLVALDRRVDGAETDAIWARWEFGRLLLLAEREAHGGLQLAHGRIDQLCQATRKGPAELRSRAQFAEEYERSSRMPDCAKIGPDPTPHISFAYVDCKGGSG